MIPNILAMRHYLEKQLKAVRENGGTGLIAELVRVEKEGEQISRDEMVAMVFLLLFAGHETTTHLISGSVYELLRNAALRDWLEEDWSRAGLAVEEFLRFISVVQFTKPRFVRKDIELGGIRLKQGEKIMPMLAAANLDPQANPHPEKLDLARKPNRHLAFGTGIHFCLGHQLARLEGVCALKALFGAGRNSRWPLMKRRSNGASGRVSRPLSICRSLEAPLYEADTRDATATSLQSRVRLDRKTRKMPREGGAHPKLLQ